jgi:hypothetical protein
MPPGVAALRSFTSAPNNAPVAESLSTSILLALYSQAGPM